MSGKTGSIRKKSVMRLDTKQCLYSQTNNQTSDLYMYIDSTNKHYHNHITTH